ncbi:DUF4442 domain-containing protein [Pseudonocardiaceae bacterium YIM PH 21723]|nr:DUF4442 domain-containing protein [Pseudonocardiaceae bacterium YIM PH 21723]
MSASTVEEVATSVLKAYRKASEYPLGKRLFSLAFSLKAPYFRTVRPFVAELRPHYARVDIKKRWGVHNHIGTVHAIAACNGLEAAMGALAEATVPAGKRWIPKGMEVRYTAKSSSDLQCIAETTAEDWAKGGDVPVRVKCVRTDGVASVEGVITIYVSDKPA